jgi:Xaa-Pro aminopeptidase
MITGDGVSAAAAVIKERNLHQARIGIEIGFGQRLGMSGQEFDQLQGLLPEVEWKDSTPLFWRLRAVKSPKEIEYLRRASEITDKGYERVLEVAREGATERELQGVMGATFLQEGSDYRGFIIVNSGVERYKMMNPYATDRALKRGDMCTFDFGAVYNGYWSDLTRSFFVGEPSTRQREFYEAAAMASETTAKAVRPGMMWEEVDRVAESFLVDRGYKGNMLHRTGHSIGLEVHEMPTISLGDKTVIEPGMVVAIEPGIYDFEIGGFRMEDICVVTEKGVEYLSNCRRELTVV